jgi:hypothetical protein
MISFTEASFADPTLPANQDRLTSDIWITRGATQGLYNAETESVFTHFFSPQGTKWADGTTANYASLSYTDWNTWTKNLHGGPPNTVGVHAVMYLVPDNIYLDVRFTSWGGSSGGFSYLRSTPAVPEPSSALLVLAGVALCSRRVLAAGRRSV